MIKSFVNVVAFASITMTAKSVGIAAVAGVWCVICVLCGALVLFHPMFATYRFQRLEQLASSVCARVTDPAEKSELMELVVFLNGVRPAWMLFEIPLTPTVVFSIVHFLVWVLVAVGAWYGFSARTAYTTAGNYTLSE